MRILVGLFLFLMFGGQQPRPLSSIAEDLERLSAELRARPETIAVPCGGSVLAAIATAKPGDAIVLAAGCRYVTGEILLAPKTGVVTIRSSATLPDRRVTPADAALMPILASGNNGRVINATGAANWRLEGIQFEPTANGAGEVVTLQDATNITLDRVLIVGGANGQKRAIRGNGQGITLTRSYIANVWAYGQDSQAFCAWDGAGPYMLTDNYLEAASENVMFGGSDGGTAASIPSDILIDGNTITKQLAWKGQGKAVKNLLELKVGKRVTIRNNVLEHNWTDAQAGWGVNVKVSNQDGANTWNVTEDVLFEGNTLRDTTNGISIQGSAYEHPAGRVTRVTIRRNLIQTTGTAFQLGGEIGELTLDRNTVENGWTFMLFYVGGVWPTGEATVRQAAYAVESLTVSGNLANHNEYGVKGEAAAIGAPTLTKHALAWSWTNNVLLGGAGKGAYPPATWFDLASVPVGVLVGR